MEVTLLEENTLGKRMRWLREKKDYKQNIVAKKLGITPYQLSRYESGKSKPDPELIAKFADFYGVTTDYLLGRSDNLNPVDKDEEDFQKFINDPELKRWHRELPKTPEDDLRRLRKMWEIMKEDRK